VLVIVHDGNIQLFFQFPFNKKTFRCLYVFKINASKSGFQCFHYLDKFLGVFFVDLNIKHINVCKNFEQNAFPFHYRLGRLRANIPQTQYSSAIAYHSHQVPLCCVFVDRFRL
jgi:hypothetical protein